MMGAGKGRWTTVLLRMSHPYKAWAPLRGKVSLGKEKGDNTGENGHARSPRGSLYL